MNKVSKSLLKGAKEALNYMNKQPIKGFKAHKIKVPKSIDVRAIRIKLHMSRREFAEQFGFPIRTLEKWEQGTRCPEGTARAYLTVIARNPQAVEAALGG